GSVDGRPLLLLMCSDRLHLWKVDKPSLLGSDDGRGKGRFGGGPPERAADDILRAHRGTPAATQGDRHRGRGAVRTVPDDRNRLRECLGDADSDAGTCPRTYQPERRDPVRCRNEEL